MLSALQPGLERAVACNKSNYFGRLISNHIDGPCAARSVISYHNSSSAWQPSSTSLSARSRRKQSPPDEAEQSVDEPVIDVTRKVEAISSQLQVHPNHVRSLVQQHQALAQLPVEKLVRQLPALAHALSIPLQQALHMAARQPSVLDCEPQQVVDNCSRLAAAAQLPVEQAMFLAARQPLLLDCPLGRLATEAAKLAAALGCSTTGALQLLSRLDGPQLQSVLNMSSSTVLQRLPEVVEALGLPTDSTRGLDLLGLVSKNPALLAASPNDIGRSTDALLIAFQSSAPGTFAAVLAKCPHLLTHPAEKLLATYQTLLMQLQVSRQTAARMLVKHPQLLRSSPENITQKLRVMAFKFYLPQAQVVSMCVRQPALLSCDSNKLQQRLQHLQHTLGTSYQATVQAVARAPQLLLVTTAAVDSKYLLLQQQTGIPAAKLGMLLLQEPAVLTLSEQHLSTTMQHMQDLLQLQQGGPDMTQLLLWAPKVLLKGHRVLLEQMRELQEFLVLPQESVADMVRRCPDILPAGRMAWLANITTMLEVLGLMPAQVQAAVVAEPRLLQLKPDTFLQQAAVTAYVIQQQQAWQQELQGLGVSQLLPLLRLRTAGQLRLLYLQATGRCGGLGQAAKAAASKQYFCSKHPGFANWLQRQQQQQRPLLPSAAEAVAAAAAATAAAAGSSMAADVEEGLQGGPVAAQAAAGMAAGSSSSVQQYRQAGVDRQRSWQQQGAQQQQQWRQAAAAAPPQASVKQSWRESLRESLQPLPRPKWQPPPQEDQQQQQAQQEQPDQETGWQQQQWQQQQQQEVSSTDSRQPALEVAPSRR